MAEREVHVRPSLIAACLALPGCALACSAFDVKPPLSDASPNRSCDLAKVPPRSSIVSTVLSERDFVFAVRGCDMGDVDEEASTRRFRAMGYDLDETCTGLAGGPSCAEPSSAAADHTDGPGGRDNALGMALYDATRAGSGSATESINSEIDNGRMTTVIRVRGYNEGPNDGQVEVAVYGATMSPDADAFLTNPPNWNDEDVWHPHVLWFLTDAVSDAGGQGILPK
jgi:hypothetical protein